MGRRAARGGAPRAGPTLRPIRHTLTVLVAPDQAFTTFTDFDRWWPVDAYSRAYAEFSGQGVTTDRLEFQGRLGGHLMEHLSNGMTLPWAQVVAWEPPARFVLAWRPHSEPQPPTELEVTFTAADTGTEVVLEHRGWERLSEDFRKALYQLYVDGWPVTLELFAAVANGEAS